MTVGPEGVTVILQTSQHEWARIIRKRGVVTWLSLDVLPRSSFGAIRWKEVDSIGELFTEG